MPQSTQYCQIWQNEVHNKKLECIITFVEFVEFSEFTDIANLSEKSRGRPSQVKCRLTRLVATPNKITVLLCMNTNLCDAYCSTANKMPIVKRRR